MSEERVMSEVWVCQRCGAAGGRPHYLCGLCGGFTEPFIPEQSVREAVEKWNRTGDHFAAYKTLTALLPYQPQEERE